MTYFLIAMSSGVRVGAHVSSGNGSSELIIRIIVYQYLPTGNYSKFPDECEGTQLLYMKMMQHGICFASLCGLHTRSH